MRSGCFKGVWGLRKQLFFSKDGCAEFSNIEGLTQIPLSKGGH